MKVLVTNANFQNATAITRSLGRKGIDVFVADNRKSARASHSKYCKGSGIYTDPKLNDKKFIEDLINMITKWDIDLLMPVGTDTTLPISYHKKKLEEYTKVPVAEFDTIMKAHDKFKITNIAKNIDVGVPKTFCPKSEDEISRICDEINFPVVIKIRMGAANEGLRYANSKQELIENYNEIESYSEKDTLSHCYSKPIIQEYIPGEIHDVCMLFNHGKIRAALTQMRIKTIPPSGGGGAVNITTKNQELRDLGIKLLGELKWHGVALAEFKHDTRDNKFKLLDLNTKFWGTTALSIEAGVNFPYLLFKMCIDGDVEPVFEYKNNLKFRWIIPNEIIHVFGSENKFRAIMDFLSFDRNVKTDITLFDIKPELFAFLSFIPKLLNKSEIQKTRSTS